MLLLLLLLPLLLGCHRHLLRCCYQPRLLVPQLLIRRLLAAHHISGPLHCTSWGKSLRWTLTLAVCREVYHLRMLRLLGCWCLRLLPRPLHLLG